VTNVSVCVSVREHISETTRPNFITFTRGVTRSSGGVAIRHIIRVGPIVADIMFS